jgi:hypothetical protein
MAACICGIVASIKLNVEGRSGAAATNGPRAAAKTTKHKGHKKHKDHKEETKYVFLFV